MLNFVDERMRDFPALFVDTEEPKNCLLLFYGYSPCIADPSNPFYDKEKAREEAFDMIWDAKTVSTNAVKYLLKNNYLPDIYNSEVLSRYSTPAEKRNDIDFLQHSRREA